jgi:hypothetical protein
MRERVGLQKGKAREEVPHFRLQGCTIDGFRGGLEEKNDSPPGGGHKQRALKRPVIKWRYTSSHVRIRVRIAIPGLSLSNKKDPGAV